MGDTFKETETAFESLRRQFREKQISRREFIDRLKQLRLRDSQGRFWMIGAQSGKWYFFDGRDWIPSDPPAEFSAKVKCSSCGQENEGGAVVCARCGKSLKEMEAASAPVAEELSLHEEIPSQAPKENFVLRRLSPSSLFLFSGGTGFILGLILGAFAGASDFFSAMAKALPDSLGMLQGTLMGGIVFAAFGGLLGFGLLGAIGYLQALLFNAIAAVAGGFQIKLDHTREKEKGEEKPG